MKPDLLTRLRSNGVLYIFSAAIFIVLLPLYQTFLLTPTGLDTVLAENSTDRSSSYLAWISRHILLFVLDRLLLLLAFGLLISLPFSLYRIIVAQEIMYQQERVTNDDEPEDKSEEQAKNTAITMPDYAWRGKGFAVLAAWASMFGLAIYLLGTLASTLYLVITSRTLSPGSAIPDTVANLSGLFAVSTNTIGIGLLGLGVLFFGAMITRTGAHLWPRAWVLFGYAGLLVGALLCISAVAVATTPGSGQSFLTTVATLLFAFWVLWLSLMLIRLKAEA